MSDTILPRCLGAVVVAFAIVGCAGEEEFDLAPVSGTVTMDGKPLGGVTVSFQPADQRSATAGPGSFGKTDEQGRFTLQTMATGREGAQVGKHRVSISTPQDASASDSDAGSFRDPIPARYNTASELTFDVPADGTDTADFKLTSGN